MKKRGRPVAHPKVKCVETGDIYDTYKAAGEAIGGSRYGVRKVCEGTQSHHHGRHYIWVTEEDNDDNSADDFRHGKDDKRRT